MRDIATQPRSRPHITALESPEKPKTKERRMRMALELKEKARCEIKNQLGSKRAAYSELHIFLLSNPSDVQSRACIKTSQRSCQKISRSL